MTPGRRYLLFLATLAGLTVLLLALGYLPTRSVAGEAALPAMFLACGICLLGSAVGGLPIARAGRRAPEVDPGLDSYKRFSASMGLRLLVVAVLTGAALWFLELPRKPFLLWLATSYVVLLVADTAFAKAVFRRL